jgi:MFS family permease
MPYWQDLFSTGYRDPTGHLNVTASQSSAIVSILSAGTFFGSLTSPFLADNIGRRLALIASTFVFIFGVILQTAATAIPLFLAGRFFAGFGVGLVSALSKQHRNGTPREMVDLGLEKNDANNGFLPVPLYQSYVSTRQPDRSPIRSIEGRAVCS